MKLFLKRIFYGAVTLLVALSLAYGGICLYWIVRFEREISEAMKEGFPPTREEYVAKYGDPCVPVDSEYEAFSLAMQEKSTENDPFDSIERPFDPHAPDSCFQDLNRYLLGIDSWVVWQDNLPDTWRIPLMTCWENRLMQTLSSATWIRLYQYQSLRLIHQNSDRLEKRISMLLRQAEALAHHPNELAALLGFYADRTALEVASGAINAGLLSDSDIRSLLNILAIPVYQDTMFYRRECVILALEISADTTIPYGCSDDFRSPSERFWRRILPPPVLRKRECVIPSPLIENPNWFEDALSGANVPRNVLRAGLAAELFKREKGKCPDQLQSLIPDYLSAVLLKASDSALEFQSGELTFSVPYASYEKGIFEEYTWTQKIKKQRCSGFEIRCETRLPFKNVLFQRIFQEEKE